MIGLPADILKPGMKALYFSGAHRLIAPFTQGLGLIFMLHQVSPQKHGEFAPNSGLMVTPDYLDTVLRDVRDAGLDIISLDEAHARITRGETSNRFACFTLDDGYRDNLEIAYPVFAKHDAPFTIYIPSDYPDGRGEIWWLALEQLVASNDEITFNDGDKTHRLCAATAAEKNTAFDFIYHQLRDRDADTHRAQMAELCETHGVDMVRQCRELIMTWDEIRQIAADPLVTIGAHSVAHPALARLPEARARDEMKSGAERIEKELGAWPEHFSYPYGDPSSAGPREFAIAEELGFKTAVTTRKGIIFCEHAGHMMALPRVSLNGAYQSSIFTRLYMSGAPFALWNKFRRVNAA